MENKIESKNIKISFFAFKNWSSRVFVSKWLLVVMGTSVGLTGCYRSVPPNFYTLTPQIMPLVSSNIKLIEVVPVEIPARLDTPLLVLQKPSGQTYMLDNQRWSSSLSNELQSGLSAGLQQKLGAIDVYNTGLTGGETTYTIATEFSRFDIVEKADQSVTDIEVMASWVVKRHGVQTTTETEKNYYHQLNCRMAFKNQVKGQADRYLNIVSTYQESLNKVIDAIAGTTIAMDANKKPTIQGILCS